MKRYNTRNIIKKFISSKATDVCVISIRRKNPFRLREFIAASVIAYCSKIRREKEKVRSATTLYKTDME